MPTATCLPLKPTDSKDTNNNKAKGACSGKPLLLYLHHLYLMLSIRYDKFDVNNFTDIASRMIPKNLRVK